MALEQEQTRSEERDVNFMANFVKSGRRALETGEARLELTGWIPKELQELVAREPLYRGESHLALATVTLEVVAEQMPEFKELLVVAREDDSDQDPKYFLRKNSDFRFEESVSGKVLRNKRTASGQRVK